MLKVLVNLQKRLDAVDLTNARCPVERKVLKNMTVLGQVPDGDLRKLVMLRQSLAGELSHLQVDMSAAHATDDDAFEKLERKFEMLKAEFDIVDAALWASIKTEFGVWNRSLCVQGDWQAVAYDNEESPFGTPILVAEIIRCGRPETDEAPPKR